MSKGFTSYKIHDQNALHFLTFATVEWIDIFTAKKFKDLVVESLSYCRQHKGLEIYGWCLMSNHIHLMAQAKEGYELSNILRDFKKHTSKQIIHQLQQETESRKDWLLRVMQEAGRKNGKNKSYQLWRNDNHPIVLESTKIMAQKLHYIHQNPVVEGLVENPEDYLYSSARNYAGGNGLLTIAQL